MRKYLLAGAIAATIGCASARACDASFAGLASFYDRSSGRQTASGEAFNDNAMTAAHRCLPFGTRLRISYAGRSVVVRINDRGPAAWTRRTIDLSKGAARELGFLRAGVVRITAEVIP